MALVTHRVGTASTSNVTSYASGSFTPAVGELLVVFVHVSGSSIASTFTTTAGITFSQVDTALTAASANTLFLFIANSLVTAATAQTGTFDCTGDAGTGAIIDIYSVSGMTKTGAGAVRQTNTLDNKTAGTPALAFVSTTLTGNPTLGAIANATNPATMTPPSGWTEGIDTGYTTPAAGLETIYRASGFAGTSLTWANASASAYGMMIVELDTNSAPTTSLNSPADASNSSNTTPTLSFTASDSDSNDVEYEIQVDTTNTFNSISGPSSVVDSYDSVNQNSSAGIDSNGTSFQALAQSFTGDGNILSNVQLIVRKSGTPIGNPTVSIYAHTGTFGSSGIPTGTPLAVADTVLSSTLSTTLALTTFTFSGTNRITLANGTKYFVALSYDVGDLNGSIWLGLDTTSPTAAGNGASATGSTWSSTSFDLPFYVNNAGTPMPLLDKLSAVDTGFVNVINGADTHPFTSGNQVVYTVQSALSPGVYYWRVRAIDPSGSNTYSSWSTTRSFTVTSGGGTNTTNFFQFM